MSPGRQVEASDRGALKGHVLEFGIDSTANRGPS